MHRKLSCLALLMAVVAVPALATGGDQGDIEVGLFAGWGFPDNYDVGTFAIDPDDDLIVGFRGGYFITPNWSVEVSAQRFSTNPDALGIPDLDFEVNSLRLNALYNFRPGEDVRPFATFGVGIENTEFEDEFDDEDPGINLGGGFRWFATERFGLRFDGRLMAHDVAKPVDDVQQNLEVTAGLFWAIGRSSDRDSDGDGVPDSRDRCPDTPPGTSVNDRGCPLDSDRDGVPDDDDDCPDTPRGATVDARGCPLDSDGDGVLDGIDRCPDTPRGATVDARGCPNDSDGDGVFDGIDRCPDTPRGATVDTWGCPLDTDGDGVFDGIDRCPDTPPGTKVDARGCPELFTEDRRTLVLEGVTFEFDQDRLTPNARKILDRVAPSLREWPEVRVEVAGHTDSLGDAGYNQDLSSRRAQAVAAYLAKKGVNPAQLTSQGYGESQPVGDNELEDGRGKNRRVELGKLN